MASRCLLHKRILVSAAEPALRRPAAGSRLLEARFHQGAGTQHNSNAFLDAALRRARVVEKETQDLHRETEQLVQMVENNSKLMRHELDEFAKVARWDLQERAKSRERAKKILDVSTGVSAGFFLVALARYNNLI